MPLPLLWIGGAALGAVLLADEREKRQSIERQRALGLSPKKHGKPLQLAPSLWQSSLHKVAPVPGCIVCCHVYGVIEHTGIWIEPDVIIELHGSGLVRAVSEKRFLAGRTGRKIYLACDAKHQPLSAPHSINRATQSMFQYRNYSVLDNNCHRFVWWCVSGKDAVIETFSDFNHVIGAHFNQGIYWDEMGKA